MDTNKENASMILSKFLTTVAAQEGQVALHGAVVLVALDRPIDRLIRLALGLGPYHPGKESPWSHCFLIAEDYRGADTRILDCTIRDPKTGGLLWDEPLADLLKQGLTTTGGIYSGKIADYDDARVTAHGLKLLRELSKDDRVSIVTEGRNLQAAGYHYDIPGLVRELVRLLMGITIQPGHNLLFCSAFCQAAYRAALGPRGDFSPNIATGDVTPDDIWYSPLGVRLDPKSIS
jgi:hypothetical protein